MKMLRAGIVLLITLCFLSCEYQSEGVWENPVWKNVSPPVIEVLSQDLSTDSFQLKSDRTIDFQFRCTTQEILKIDFYLDGYPTWFSFKGSSGTFSLNEYTISGYHTLTAVFVTRSGTESLADQAGMENYILQKNWVFYIPGMPVALLKYTVVNGFLHVSWNKYPFNDHCSYVIEKYTNCTSRSIDVGMTTEFIDSTYVGEPALFNVKMKLDGVTYDWGFGESGFHIPDITCESYSSQQATFSWDKSMYFGAIDSVKVFRYNGNDFVLIKSTVDLNDNNLTLQNPDTYDEELMIQLVPRNRAFYNPCQQVFTRKCYFTF